jgi:acyl-CoA synthetase (NDP forming)
LDAKQLVKNALASGKKSLTEAESKKVLNSYGIPVVEEAVATTLSETVAAATRFGYPVVVKAVGENILHKTEKNLVHLNLMNERDVEEASKRIVEKAPDAHFLVQPQIKGKREFVAGLYRDHQFGPVILFGLGGVFTEAIADIALRLAPLTRTDAAEMIDGIKAQSFAGPFRGEKAIDKETMIGILLGLSTIAIQHSEVAEIDINPVIVKADGSLVAVDALITLDRSEEQPKASPKIPAPDIHRLFFPRSVAFIGASSNLGKWGHNLICNTIAGGFKGNAYPVNLKGGVIADTPVVKTVAELPGDVDLAVVTLPAKFILDLIPQLAEKGIKSVVLITSGFGETGAEGKKLEKKLVQKARDTGVLILGPNTMGICNPHCSFYCVGANIRPIPGSTAVVAQSGNMGLQLLAFAEKQGIGIRAFSGSGNEAMLTIEDYMEAFEVDDRTRTVMLYIESVKNGRRFFESALRVSKKKPIVLLKGGQTRAGRKAASSHTGAMATDARLFDAVCHQAGIVNVDQPMELLDLSAGFASLPLPKGNRVAIMTLGGGWGVVTADLCNQHGLDVPELTSELIAKMDEILPPYWSRSNPVDLVGENDLSLPLTVMEALLAWDGCDAVINMGIYGRRHLLKRRVESVITADSSFTKAELDSIVQMLTDFENNYISEIVRLMEAFDKPVYGVSLGSNQEDFTVNRVKGHDLKAVFFETPERAVKTAARMVEYQRFRTRHKVT